MTHPFDLRPAPRHYTIKELTALKDLSDGGVPLLRHPLELLRCITYRFKRPLNLSL
jgi:hypothetical protein